MLSFAFPWIREEICEGRGEYSGNAFDSLFFLLLLVLSRSFLLSSQCQSISRCCDEGEKGMNPSREGRNGRSEVKRRGTFVMEKKGKEGISEQRRSSATSAIEER